MTHTAGPAYRVQERTILVAPEIRNHILRGVTLVCIHQPQAATNNGVYDGPASAAHMFWVDHFHPHADFERALHALRQLGRREKGHDWWFCVCNLNHSSSFKWTCDRQEASAVLPSGWSQRVEWWHPPTFSSDSPSSLRCSGSHLQHTMCQIKNIANKSNLGRWPHISHLLTWMILHAPSEKPLLFKPDKTETFSAAYLNVIIVVQLCICAAVQLRLLCVDPHLVEAPAACSSWRTIQ